MKSLSVTIQMKATEQYFPVVLFIMLYKVILTFESVDEILKCDHLNESYSEQHCRPVVLFIVVQVHFDRMILWTGRKLFTIKCKSN